MTETEILEKVITELSLVNIPIAYFETIGKPIKDSVDLLKLLYSAILQQRASQEGSKKETSEVKEETNDGASEVNQNGTNE